MIIQVMTVGEDGESLFRFSLNTKKAVADSYLSFIKAVVELLYGQRDDLEKEANQSGRTTIHQSYDAFGALPIELVIMQKRESLEWPELLNK